MKTISKLLLMSLGALFVLYGCNQDTFSPNVSLDNYMGPSELNYHEILNARENAALKTGTPTIQTNGLVPFFEIVSAKKADGTELDETYMKDVTITNPVEKTVDLDPEDYIIFEGDTIKSYTAYNYSKAGVIEIADENNFGIDDYYFSVKVSTQNGESITSATFNDVFHLGVGPGLVTNLLYSPIAQNLVTNTNATTTQPYLITGNPDVTFSLASDTDKLKIDTQTGVISLQEDYTTTQNDTIYPTVEVTSNISQEVTEFQGSSFLFLVASNDPVDLPKQTNYFFYPTLEAESKLYGYEKTITQPGDVTEAKTWIQAAPSPLAADERPESVIGNKSLWTNMTAGDWEPHESYITINPQDLTQYRLGYDLAMVFYTKNQYVEYKTDGATPTELEIYISTDYTGDDETSTWIQINDQLSCQINSTTSTPFIGTPYPGDQKLGDGDPDGRKDPTRNADAKWVRNELNLNPYKDSKSFALKFKIVATYTGPGKPSSGAKGRPGRYYVSDVHFKASEE
ncbi:hypothetical protein [Flavicella marina]|uniref:hypothetical protein n=1 Tax=Flavicella marina TaxID=1475951 RepID=UPI001264E204|nr:hypothetical protein [Flavicella marina]